MTIADLKQGDTFTLNGIRHTIKERTVYQGQECARCESENDLEKDIRDEAYSITD